MIFSMLCTSRHTHTYPQCVGLYSLCFKTELGLAQHVCSETSCSHTCSERHSDGWRRTPGVLRQQVFYHQVGLPPVWRHMLARALHWDFRIPIWAAKTVRRFGKNQLVMWVGTLNGLGWIASVPEMASLLPWATCHLFALSLQPTSVWSPEWQLLGSSQPTRGLCTASQPSCGQKAWRGCTGEPAPCCWGTFQATASTSSPTCSWVTGSRPRPVQAPAPVLCGWRAEWRVRAAWLIPDPVLTTAAGQWGRGRVHPASLPTVLC